MTIVTRNQKIYFAAVGLFAFWVAIWGIFIPEHIDKAIPWLVPPFHARFIGAIYLSGAVILGGAIRAHQFAEVRVPIFFVAIWTGSLFVISLFYLREFDFSHSPVWFWFGAYIAYPLIGFWLLWTHRSSQNKPADLSSSPNWIRKYFLKQGVLITILALALLFAPELMVNIWPWKITRMLAQIYSGPLLAYGLSSIMLSRQRTWPEVHIMALGFFVLAIGVLIVSIIHGALFSSSNPATWVWFGGFLLIAGFLGTMIIRSLSGGDSK